MTSLSPLARDKNRAGFESYYDLLGDGQCSISITNRERSPIGKLEGGEKGRITINSA